MFYRSIRSISSIERISMPGVCWRQNGQVNNAFKGCSTPKSCPFIHSMMHSKQNLWWIGWQCVRTGSVRMWRQIEQIASSTGIVGMFWVSNANHRFSSIGVFVNLIFENIQFNIFYWIKYILLLTSWLKWRRFAISIPFNVNHYWRNDRKYF